MQRMRKRRALPFQKLRLQRAPSPRLLAMREHWSRQHLGIWLPHHKQMAILSPQVRSVQTVRLQLAVNVAGILQHVISFYCPVRFTIPGEDYVAGRH